MARHSATSKKVRFDLLETLINQATPSFNAWHFAEPKLRFGGGGMNEDPKTGITLFGPAGLTKGPRTSIRLGIIGTGDTIQGVRNWVTNAALPIRAGLSPRGKVPDPLMAPDFPGFTAEHPFYCTLDIAKEHCLELNEPALRSAINASSDFSARVKAIVALMSERLATLADKDPAPDVVVCAMPRLVEESCGPAGRKGFRKKVFMTDLQKWHRKLQRQAEKTQQGFLDFFSHEEAAIEEAHLYRDFHNSLKAHAMASKLPTQLIWESTLLGQGGTEDRATTAWNFFTALYYKAGNLPWELEFPTPRTCFVGITFYRESPDPNANTRTCLAQAFSETGEGLVLKGERVSWDKDRDKKAHMSRHDSYELLKRVLELYRKHFGDPPKRVVVHKSSRFWPEEQEGLKAALGDIQSYDFLALERRGIRFMRLGAEPPVRGTVIQLGRRNYLIYTRGYVPFLRMYPGMRIPNPLEVVEHFGDSSAEKVCGEILSLTKLNWNTCAFASADPITVAFSRQVSTILKELPKGVVPLEKYRFYM